MLIIGLNENVLTKTSDHEMCFEAWLRNNFKFDSNLYGLNLNRTGLYRSKIYNASATDLFDYRSRNFFKVLVQIIRLKLSIYELGLTFRYFHEVYKFRFLNLENCRNITTFMTIASETWVKPAWFSKLKLEDPRIIYINLSSSSSPKTVDEIELVGWERLNLWDEVWVLDDHQKQLFANHLIYSKSKVITMGCPFWTDSLKPFTEFENKGNYIAIFDMQPTRRFIGWSSLYDCGYFDSASILKFIRDILVVSARMDKTCILKSKRVAPRYSDTEYYQGIENLKQEFKNFIYADAEIAPHRIIKDSLVTISIPFTSTAIIASELRVPSLYYDPIGRVLPNDPSARTTRVVSGQTELYAELYKLIPEKFL
jgi:polysaccharide biosynthesis PFTS motif protein